MNGSTKSLILRRLALLAASLGAAVFLVTASHAAAPAGHPTSTVQAGGEPEEWNSTGG